MREFEFRLWDIRSKRMIYKSTHKTRNIFGRIAMGLTGDYILNQFTGFYDVNGEKIFENDILKSNINAAHFPTEYEEVIFEDGAFWLQYASSHWADVFIIRLNQSIINQSQLTKIGNRFENPEILKDLDKRLKKLKGVKTKVNKNN